MPTTKDVLIARYVSGNCSPEEEELLLAWVRKSRQNEQELELAKKAWEDAGHAKQTRIYNVDQAWKEFLEKKDLPSQKTTHLSRAFFLRTAAVLVLLLVVGFVIRLAVYKNTVPIAETALIKKPLINTISDIQIISIYSADSAMLFLLPDSSRVMLNRYSSLHYTRFYNMDKRMVYLNGEAFFDVARNDSIPFYVICGQVSTRVTGTSFNVKTMEHGRVAVSVISGTVEVEDNRHPEKRIVLQQQEKAVFIPSASSFSKVKSSNKDFKWKEKKTFKKRIQSFIQKFRKKT